MSVLVPDVPSVDWLVLSSPNMGNGKAPPILGKLAGAIGTSFGLLRISPGKGLVRGRPRRFPVAPFAFFAVPRFLLFAGFPAANPFVLVMPSAEAPIIGIPKLQSGMLPKSSLPFFFPFAPLLPVLTGDPCIGIIRGIMGIIGIIIPVLPIFAGDDALSNGLLVADSAGDLASDPVLADLERFEPLLPDISSVMYFVSNSNFKTVHAEIQKWDHDVCVMILDLTQLSHTLYSVCEVAINRNCPR